MGLFQVQQRRGLACKPLLPPPLRLGLAERLVTCCAGSRDCERALRSHSRCAGRRRADAPHADAPATQMRLHGPDSRRCRRSTRQWIEAAGNRQRQQAANIHPPCCCRCSAVPCRRADCHVCVPAGCAQDAAAGAAHREHAACGHHRCVRRARATAQAAKPGRASSERQQQAAARPQAPAPDEPTHSAVATIAAPQAAWPACSHARRFGRLTHARACITARLLLCQAAWPALSSRRASRACTAA